MPADIIVKAARLYGSSAKAGIYYTMGITQHAHGTENVFSIANLALMTGNLGKESAGVNPLRGQNNVQGATDMGCIPNMYPGYQRVSIPAIKQKFEALWKTTLSDKEGLTATEMLPAAEKGSLKALYIMGENPVVSDPDTTHVVKALKTLDLLVVQDIFMTETAELADVVLPGSSFAEKVGTFTNTERRVQRVRRAVSSPGSAMKDSLIIMELSKRMGYEMSYPHTVEVFREMGQAWPALAGMSYARLEDGGLQWPCPTPEHPGTQFLFKGGFPRGKGKFTLVKYKPSAEETDAEFPFILTTGRQLFQYHTGSMTRRVKPIDTLCPEVLCRDQSRGRADPFHRGRIEREGKLPQRFDHGESARKQTTGKRCCVHSLPLQGSGGQCPDEQQFPGPDREDSVVQGVGGQDRESVTPEKD